MSKVAWIGLGVMGFPMAGHLKTRGGTTSWCSTAPAPRPMPGSRSFGGTVGATPRRGGRMAPSSSSPASAMTTISARDARAGRRIRALRPGAMFIDHTTASATIARELHAAAKERGAGALDAPVSGGQSGAENGTLTVMVGGDESGFRQGQAGDRGLCARRQSDRARQARASSPRWSIRSASAG